MVGPRAKSKAERGPTLWQGANRRATSWRVKGLILKEASQTGLALSVLEFQHSTVLVVVDCWDGAKSL